MSDRAPSSALSAAEWAALDRYGPIAHRMPELFNPGLWDRIQGQKDRQPWLNVWNLRIDHPIVRVRRALFHLIHSEPTEALELLAGATNPLAIATRVKTHVFIAYENDDHDAFTAIVEQTNNAEEYATSDDPLDQEAAMLLLDARGIAHYYLGEPALALAAFSGCLFLALALQMRYRAKQTRSHRNSSLRALGHTPPPVVEEPSYEPRRAHYQAGDTIKKLLYHAQYDAAHAEAVRTFTGTSIPGLVRALEHYDAGRYHNALEELEEQPVGRSDFAAHWCALALQVIARLGDDSGLDARRVLEVMDRSLSDLRAPWVTVLDIKRLYPLAAVMAGYTSMVQRFFYQSIEDVAVLHNESGYDGIWHAGRQITMPNGPHLSYAPKAVRNLIYRGELGRGPTQEMIASGTFDGVSKSSRNRYRRYVRFATQSGVVRFTNHAAILVGLQQLSAVRPEIYGAGEAAVEAFRAKYRSVGGSVV